jgi:hypothetical protein
MPRAARLAALTLPLALAGCGGFGSAPLPDGGTIGMAVDQTEREEAGIEIAESPADMGAALVRAVKRRG